jgi:hypothetical protein
MLGAVSRTCRNRSLIRGRRDNGDRSHRVGRRHFDPTVSLLGPERHVDALLEAELLGIELDRTLLIGHRNDDRADLVDASLRAGHDILIGFGFTTAETAEPSETHRGCLGQRRHRLTN